MNLYNIYYVDLLGGSDEIQTYWRSSHESIEEVKCILSAPFHLGQDRVNAYLQRFGFRAEMDDMGRIRIYDADTGKLRYTIPKS